MNADAVARIATGARVPHGSSDDPEVLDFSANTNPETPPGVADVYADALEAARSYPDDASPEFCEAAASHVDCGEEQVIPTPGGLAAIRLALATTVDPGDRVLVPSPSFGEYAREVELQGADPVFAPYDEILDRDPRDFTGAIVCNPNNPTGDAYDGDALRAYADRCRNVETLLLVDEAFLGFTAEQSLAGHAGVVVARSLTKLFGLPGLRAGFAVASGDRLDRLDAARRTWNLGVPAATVGAHSMRQREFVAETRDRVAGERERLRVELSDGFDVVAPADGTPLHDSTAPFLLLDAGSGERADRALATAREAGLALRDARTFRGLDSHVRVAVRLPAENDRLCEVLGDV